MIDGLSLRSTALDDLPWVLATEARPEISRWVLRWPADRHRRAIDDPGEAHLIAALPDGTRVGYAILRGLEDAHASIELTRVVARPSGCGYGRASVRALKLRAFEHYGAERFWLDVLEHNTKAQALYRSEGFVGEGHLRNAVVVDGHRASLLVMSVLRGEYARAPAAGDRSQP